MAEQVNAALLPAASCPKHLLGRANYQFASHTIDLNPYVRLWLGHAYDEAVKAVWFDRTFLVRAD